jgi:hypothetical protein
LVLICLFVLTGCVQFFSIATGGMDIAPCTGSQCAIDVAHNLRRANPELILDQ